MGFQLHFALRIKVISQKVANLVQIKVCGFWQKSKPKLRFLDLKIQFILPRNVNFHLKEFADFYLLP